MVVLHDTTADSLGMMKVTSIFRLPETFSLIQQRLPCWYGNRGMTKPMQKAKESADCKGHAFRGNVLFKGKVEETQKGSERTKQG